MSPTSSLQELKLHDNYLYGVPVEVFQLPNIEQLELQHNQITSLDPGTYVSRLGSHGKRCSTTISMIF